MSSPYGKPKNEFGLNDCVITRFIPENEHGEVRPIHLSRGTNKCYEHLYPGRYSYTGVQYIESSIEDFPDNFEEAREILIETIEKRIAALKAEIKIEREKLERVEKLEGPTKRGKLVDLSEANY
jgi:hypothetical protein